MSPRRRISLYAFAALCLLIVAVWIFRHRPIPQSVEKLPGNPPATLQQLAAQLTALEAKENEVERTVWAPELVAEQCGVVFDSLWDSLNAATNKFEVLRAFPVQELSLPEFGQTQSAGQGVELHEPNGATRRTDGPGWLQILDQIRTAGWELVQFEFRHNFFATNSLGQPRNSVFYTRADLVNPILSRRATLEGDLKVDWAAELSSDGLAVAVRIDASHLRLLTRSGEPPFREVLFEEARPFEKSHFIDPLILYDLDGNGLSEIILAARNLVFKRQPDGRYTQQPLCRHFTGRILSGIIADFDGDGAADFLGATFDGLLLFKGLRTGEFVEPGRLVWAANPRLKYAQVLTCGDVDRDGDLDVWLGQYKNPYERGQMPTPYYDANDGNPSYLLLNDGQGNFADATDDAGLGQKRGRRCYSGSLVDLDADGNLDLLVVSDFAGVEVYANDGHGRFSDMTAKWLPEHRLFGMAHTTTDFDLDGHLDFLVMGMHCPTAQRLDRLGLKRPGYPDFEEMRPRMTEGNRLYLGRAEGGFRSGSLGGSIARSGWSWGCSAFDWDNDGYPDVYIANGHETRQSVRDYEREFWLHDIYVGNSKDDLVRNAFFGAKMARTRGHGWSYGGYEINRLFLNRHGESFLEAGHLLGVAIEQDSRNLVTDDLDGDGRVDVVFTTFEAWPKVRQTLRVFQNKLEQTGNWIGFRFPEQGNGISPVGARIALRYAGKTVVRQLITGDSHRSQHPNTVHFGLGQNSSVESVQVQWLGGQRLVIEHPAINRYHAVVPSR